MWGNIQVKMSARSRSASPDKKDAVVRQSFGGNELLRKSCASKLEESQLEPQVEDLEEFPSVENTIEEPVSMDERAPRETALFKKVPVRNHEIINSRNNAESQNNIMGLLGKMSYFS
jgi:hypothetical protein